MPSSNKTIFRCTKCDAQYPKWSGRCLECGAWSTLEEVGVSTKKEAVPVKLNAKNLVDFRNITNENFSRIKINISEFDRVLGGGIVPGSLILLGGEPGIGKSTLALQVFKSLETNGKDLLYVSGEESGEQVKLRADRIQYKPEKLKFFSETNIEQIIAALIEIKPLLAIIDSIQTVYSDEVEGGAGNITQVRASTVKLLEVAKKHNIPIIITGHVTKDGVVSGPKTLEHLVDVVIYIEGDKYHGFRVVRATKNRFGSTNELGLFEMTKEGLQEVKNPTETFLQEHTEALSGAAISCFAEGTRAFLVEIQALVSPTLFGYPQRKTSGFDQNRLQMLSAVISKRANLNLTNKDIHLNVVGGFKANEPALDLAVCAAIISGLKNIVLNRQTLILGEVGLGGEVRTVHNLDKRLKEAEKLGFKKAIVPKTSVKSGLELVQIKNIGELPLLRS